MHFSVFALKKLVWSIWKIQMSLQAKGDINVEKGVKNYWMDQYCFLLFKYIFENNLAF